MKPKKQRKPPLRRVCNRLIIPGLILSLAALCGPVRGQVQRTPARPPASRPDPTPQLKGRIIEGVRILGNTSVSQRLIDNLIRTKKGDRFDPATVQEDYQRIFELRKFANVEARVEPTRAGGVIIVFQITEQQLIHSVAFNGNRAISTETLRTAIDLRAGQAIDAFRIAIARQTIISQYRDKNYPFAEVRVPSEPLTKRADVIFNIVQGPRVRIRKVDFIGAKSFDGDRLAKNVKTRSWLPIFRAGKYDATQAEEDVASLHKFYEDHGFFDVRVGRKLIYSPDVSEMEVDFIIDEGRRYTIRQVNFEFNSHLHDAQLRQGLKLTPGNFWDQEKLSLDVKRIVKDYSGLGYIYESDPSNRNDDYLRIEPRHVVFIEPGKVDLVYDIHEGKPFHLRSVYVKGNSISQEKLVLREFRHMAPGTLYNSGDVEDALARLRSLPYFSSVTVTPVGEDPEYRDVQVEVTEGRTATFNVGAGLNSNGGIGGDITLRQNNFDIAQIPNDPRDILSDRAFRGAGQAFIATFQPGTIATNASLRFVDPYFLDQPYAFSEEIYLRDRLREHYDDRRLGDSVQLTKRFDDFIWSSSVGLRAEQVKIYRVDNEKYRPEEILAARGHHELTGLSLSLRRDTTNPGFLPYTGTVTNFGYEYVGAAGGDYSFSRLSVKWDGYQAVSSDLLDRKTVLGLHGFAGYIPGNAPFFERFYEGGIGSLRGFAFRGVSPRAGRGIDPVGGDPIGGNFATTATAELNFPVYGETLRGVVFTDVGDIEPQFHLGTIRTSIGTGVRLTLPILGQTPIAIDFATPITKGRYDQTQFISFSLGFAQ
ncbi:MAG TPA: POTRA domain-containing protein [Tepidisphaeraceae bacterium]|nr:POTRA domain-containing protein [Tepidisphaeraceae bacterium]